MPKAFGGSLPSGLDGGKIPSYIDKALKSPRLMARHIRHGEVGGKAMSLPVSPPGSISTEPIYTPYSGGAGVFSSGSSMANSARSILPHYIPTPLRSLTSLHSKIDTPEIVPEIVPIAEAPVILHDEGILPSEVLVPEKPLGRMAMARKRFADMAQHRMTKIIFLVLLTILIFVGLGLGGYYIPWQDIGEKIKKAFNKNKSKQKKRSKPRGRAQLENKNPSSKRKKNSKKKHK